MKGNAFIFGDDIDTDVIAPGGVLHKGMEELTRHSMEAIFPKFSDSVSQGDLIVAGRNFGCGSSREQAPLVLKAMGINLVLAKSFSRLFFRNAVNVGLKVGLLKEGLQIENGQEVEYSLDEATLFLENGRVGFQAPSGILNEIISEGGLVNYVKIQLEGQE